MQLRLTCGYDRLKYGLLAYNSGATTLKFFSYTTVLVTVLGCSTAFTTKAQTLRADAAKPAASDSNGGIVVPIVKPLGMQQEADLVYKILSAEIAGRRGRVDLAAQNYIDAAQQSDDVRLSERAVKLAMYGRNWDQADQAVSRWVELVPASVDAWQHKVQISLQRKEVDNAADALEQIVDISGQEPTVIIPGLVNSLLRQTDATLGAEVLAKLGARFPDSADAQYGIGRFAMSNGDRETALRAFEKALEIDPNNGEALLSRARLLLEAGDGEQALAGVKKFVTQHPKQAAVRMGYARLLVEAGKFEAATAEFSEIATRFPKDAESMFAIGLLALEIKRIDRAEQYLQEVVTLDKYVDESYYYLARISDSRREYQHAIERYESVQGGENFLDAQIRGAELYGLTGELEQGRERIANLRTMTDEQAIQVELISAESRMLVGNDQQAEAHRVLSAGLKDYPDDTSLRYSRALIAEQLGHRVEFEKDLNTVIAAEPENGYALNALGYFLVDRNERLDEAEDLLLRAIRLLPDDPAVVDSVGWLYYRQGKYDQALEILRRAHKLLPDAEIAAHLGEVLWVSGDQTGATAVWREALKGAPDHAALNKVMQKYIR